MTDRLLCQWLGHLMEPLGVSIMEADEFVDEQGDPLLFDVLSEQCARCGVRTLRLYRKRQVGS